MNIIDAQQHSISNTKRVLINNYYWTNKYHTRMIIMLYIDSHSFAHLFRLPTPGFLHFWLFSPNRSANITHECVLRYVIFQLLEQQKVSLDIQQYA